MIYRGRGPDAPPHPEPTTAAARTVDTGPAPTSPAEVDPLPKIAARHRSRCLNDRAVEREGGRARDVAGCAGGSRWPPPCPRAGRASDVEAENGVSCDYRGLAGLCGFGCAGRTLTPGDEALTSVIPSGVWTRTMVRASVRLQIKWTMDWNVVPVGFS